MKEADAGVALRCHTRGNCQCAIARGIIAIHRDEDSVEHDRLRNREAFRLHSHNTFYARASRGGIGWRSRSALVVWAAYPLGQSPDLPDPLSRAFPDSALGWHELEI